MRIDSSSLTKFDLYTKDEKIIEILRPRYSATTFYERLRKYEHETQLIKLSRELLDSLLSDYIVLGRRLKYLDYQKDAYNNALILTNKSIYQIGRLFTFDPEGKKLKIHTGIKRLPLGRVMPYSNNIANENIKFHFNTYFFISLLVYIISGNIFLGLNYKFDLGTIGKVIGILIIAYPIIGVALGIFLNKRTSEKFYIIGDLDKTSNSIWIPLQAFNPKEVEDFVNKALSLMEELRNVK